ncbi:uncharacterized protein METZ01_LOCUS115515, partial [marine metagenome]
DRRREGGRVGGMKKTLCMLLLGTLLMAGCGEKTHYSPPLTEEEVKIIAEAIDVNMLQLRGKKGEELYYASNEQTPYTEWAKVMYGNGQIQYLVLIKDGKWDGLLTGWYENGQKESEQNWKDGKPDGLAMLWHENGQKKAEGNYKDGKKVGFWIYWHEDGTERGRETYKDDDPVED